MTAATSLSTRANELSFMLRRAIWLNSLAAKHFRAKKSWDVTVVIATNKDGEVVFHSNREQP
jgi:hypothetical protein